MANGIQFIDSETVKAKVRIQENKSSWVHMGYRSVQEFIEIRR